MPSKAHFVALPEDEFVEESIHIVEQAESTKVVLRIIGAVAVYIHSTDEPRAMGLYKKIERLVKGKTKFTDLDLMAYGKQGKQIRELFEKTVSFKPDFMVNNLFGNRRLLYYHPKGYYHVDVFFNKLRFSHDVDFGSNPGKGRLELDYPTITLADIVLEKTQIHQLNLKDVVDLIVLFVGHDIGASQSKEVVDGTYVASVLSDDWGFWYDAVHNLDVVKQFADKFYLKGKLTKKEHVLVTERINKLLEIIDETPKTKKWLKRAEKGTSMPWCREVEELIR